MPARQLGQLLNALRRSVVAQYGTVVFAGLLYAIALKYFVLPAGVILTGTEGIAASLSYYFDSPGLFVVLYAVFQAGLLAFGYTKVSKVFAVRSLVVIATVITGLVALPPLSFASPEPQNERIMLVIFGGLLAGVAKAIAFRHRGSTGDEDIVAAYFAMKYLKPVGSIAILAAVVSTTFGLALTLLKTGHLEPAVNTLMYTCLYIFISAETLNNLYHKFKLTMLTVVTRHAEAVGRAIRAASAHRTFTVQDGTGGHSGQPFQMIRTIVTLEELPEVLAAVEHADAKSFHYHHSIDGITGRYYIAPIG